MAETIEIIVPTKEFTKILKKLRTTFKKENCPFYGEKHVEKGVHHLAVINGEIFLQSKDFDRVVTVSLGEDDCETSGDRSIIFKLDDVFPILNDHPTTKISVSKDGKEYEGIAECGNVSKLFKTIDPDMSTFIDIRKEKSTCLYMDDQFLETLNKAKKFIIDDGNDRTKFLRFEEYGGDLYMLTTNAHALFSEKVQEVGFKNILNKVKTEGSNQIFGLDLDLVRAMFRFLSKKERVSFHYTPDSTCLVDYTYHQDGVWIGFNASLRPSKMQQLVSEQVDSKSYKNTAVDIELDREQLINFLKTNRKLDKNKEGALIKPCVESGKTYLVHSSLTIKSVSVLDSKLKFQGKDIPLSNPDGVTAPAFILNFDYLLDLLAFSDDEKVTLRCVDCLNPVHIDPESNSDRTLVVMPIRFKNNEYSMYLKRIEELKNS